jgi:threonine dehydrogenase-like Zn-dependent dehydrogenase
MVGFVEEVGDGVASYRAGDRVAVWRDSGPTRTGAYAQYLALPAENVVPVSTSLEPEEIAPLELAMCVQVSFDQIMQFGTLSGASIGVTGLGPAGLIAVQMARAYGAESIVAYDPVPSRCRLALSLGADEAMDPASENRSDSFLDVGMDMTGLRTAIDFLIQRSTKAVTMFGVVREDLVFPPSKWYGGFALVGYGSHNLGAAKRALTLINQDRLRLAPLVTHRLGLDHYAEAVALLESKEAIKVLFDPWSD